jgi:cell division GTPase FtsZ
MNTENDDQKDDIYINPTDKPEVLDEDFDFLGSYDDAVKENDDLLPENTASSAISCAFLGIGGGGGKMAKAFMDLGFSKTLLINTTEKDQPLGVDPEHFLLVPGADGVGKDVNLGKQVLGNESALVEDALRTRIGKVDWLFILAGGGGGTGSACSALDGALQRYLQSTEAGGKAVYVISKPTAQELLNPTIKTNFQSLLDDVVDHPHIIIDNEKQLELLRGKVGMLDMYPAANTSFAKLFWQVLKLANESSPIQSFDSKDLEKCLTTNGRIFIGSTIVKNPDRNLGANILQGSLRGSPCPGPSKGPQTGVLLLIVPSPMASDPEMSKRMEAAFSYVGGRANTLFSGVYIRDRIPGLVAITIFGGMSK